jgi:predicted esterase
MQVPAHVHQGQPVINAGTALREAKLIVILIHGRGSTAEAMMPLVEALQMDEVGFMLPQAALNRWYPNTAFGTLEANEPDLSSALATVDMLVAGAREIGVPDQRIAFGGFSQGACLAAEYVLRNAKEYAGLFVLSGAMIGPSGMPRNYPSSFEGMPVFIGGSDVDPWVAHNLLHDTAGVFEELGASVDLRTYPGMGHTINQDEIDSVRALLSNSLA